VETFRVYRTVGRNRSLRRVLGAYFAFSAQEYGVWIAIVVFAYEQGGPTTAGVVAIAQLIPSAIVAPVGSVLGDRMRRDRALALGYALQAAANAACAIALWTSPPLVRSSPADARNERASREPRERCGARILTG